VMARRRVSWLADEPVKQSGCEAPMSADVSEYQELVDWLTIKVAGYVNVPPGAIGIDTPLADCGIDSVSGLTLCADLECEKGFAVDTTIVWDYATIDAIAAYLVAERAAP
jgi:acyl carrier protein